MQQTKKVNYYRLSLKGGQCSGLSLTKEYVLAGKGGGSFVYIAPVFDTSELDATFHRLTLSGSFEKCKFEIMAAAANVDLSEEMEDASLSVEDKLALLQNHSYERRVNTRDMLLHQLTGRYLWVVIRVMAADIQSQFEIQGFTVEFPRCSFVEYLPEIYQEDESSFFSRYMSVLQSLYVDLEDQVTDVPAQLDYETCDPENLLLFARWTGLDESGRRFSPEQIQYLIHNLQQIQSGKGTTDVLKKIIFFLYGKDAQIVEYFKWNDWMKEYSSKVEHYQRLFGKDEGVFTLILDCVSDKRGETPDKEQVMKVIQDYIPLGMTCNLVYLRENYNMDIHCYMDVNSVLSTPQTADTSGFVLGSNQVLG